MKLAVHFGSTDLTANPGDVAHEAEIRGFEGIVFPEHTHMPVDHELAPYSGTEVRMEHYRRLYNPLIAMAWAASRTTTLSIGTCVALPAENDPIILAKSLASLDAMSNGRIVYGVGFGWNEHEMRNHGVDPKRRRATVRQTMLLCRSFWTDEEAGHDGDIINVSPSWCWPKPKPGAIPILMGAKGTDQVFDHIIEYCDGWVPSVRGEPEVFAEDVKRLKGRAADAGRDPATIRIDTICPFRSMELFEKLDRIGVDRLIIHLPFADLDEVKRQLDHYAADYLPHFS